MSEKRNYRILWFALIAMIIGLIFCAIQSPGQVQAGPDLPPRTTPTPSPSDDKKKDKDKDEPIGAGIELQVTNAPAGVWSLVQWQDTARSWHNVEGWESELDTGGSIRWWVAAKDFNTGPFRWIITQGQGGSTLGASELFKLPQEVDETVFVIVSLGQ